MKINFDQIFGNSTPEPKSQFKKTSHMSQASTAFQFHQLERVAQKNLTPSKKKQDKNTFKLSNKRKDQTMRVLQRNKQTSQNYQWYIQAKLDQNPNQINKNTKKVIKQTKNMSKSQIESLTQRLTQKHKCNKKVCKDICQYQISRKIKQQILPVQAPIRKHKRNLTQTCQFQKNNPSQLHERLYNEYKSKQFNNLELSIQYQQKQQQNYKLNLYKNENYTKNYVPFYDRLGHQIDRNIKKNKFYAKNIIHNNQILKFHPNIQVSKTSFSLRHRKALQPKKQKHQIKGYAEMRAIQRLSRSLDTSMQKTLNRSVQIVQQKQQKFIQKMVAVFQQNGYISIKPQAIQKLDEIQFQKFFPLISQLQNQQNMQIHQFQTKLRKYFENLPKNEKLALRKHDLDKQKQQKIQRKQAQTSRNIPIASHNASQTSKKAYKDYLHKIKEFI